MASTSYSLVICVATIMLLGRPGFGSGARVVVEPQQLTSSTDQLNVTCVAEGPAYWANTVVAILLFREGQDTPIVSIKTKETVEMGPGSKNDMKAEGHIEGDASKSYLTLTLDNPSVRDAGLYKCHVFFFDEKSKMKQENVTGNVTFQEQDISSIIDNLEEKVSKLMKTIQDHKSNSSKQRDRIETLETQLGICKDDPAQQTQHFNNLTATIKRQNETINGQNERIEELEEGVAKQEENVKAQEQQLELLGDFIKQQNETIQRLEAQIKNQENGMDRKGPCPNGWTHYKADQTCFKLFGKDSSSQRFNWSQSREACKEFGGDLVQISDDRKNSFVHDVISCGSGRYNVAWIGAKNQYSVGFDFRYVDGSPVRYSPWLTGYPKGDFAGPWKCVFMVTRIEKARWRDYNCDTPGSYVCSVPAVAESQSEFFVQPN